MSDVGYGKLYKEYEIEFAKTIRNIAMLGYGCVFACHTEIKNIEVATDVVQEQIRPKLDKRAFDIINGLVDIIGIGVMKFNEKGESRRVLYTTETPTIKAGNRFTYFPPVIDFSYQSVLDNLSDAIEAEATNNNAVIVDKIEQTKEELSYRDLLKEAKALWEEIVIVNGEPDEEAARKVLKRVEMIFGRPVKISEITEDQVSLLQLVVLDMRELAEEK